MGIVANGKLFCEAARVIFLFRTSESRSPSSKPSFSGSIRFLFVILSECFYRLGKKRIWFVDLKMEKQFLCLLGAD